VKIQDTRSSGIVMLCSVNVRQKGPLKHCGILPHNYMAVQPIRCRFKFIQSVWLRFTSNDK